MEAKKMTVREVVALKEIRKYDGKYSIHWTTKSREKLVARGLATVEGNCVAITEAGRIALAGLVPVAR